MYTKFLNFLTSNKDIISVFEKSFSEFMGIINRKNELSIDNIKEIYSPLCDETILNVLKENIDWNFISGVFTMSLNEKKNVDLDVKFYFQDSNQKWIQKTNSNNIRLSKFNDESKELFLKEKVLEFEINHPS